MFETNSKHRAAKATTSGVYSSVEELLQQRGLAKDLTLETRKQSRAIRGGVVRTRYKARGMEFAEVRPYQPGDDIRTIDWRVTARMQTPYTKLFQEEKERPVFVMVDQRSPMFFGSKTIFKSVYAAKMAATIAWIAHANNDRIGALLFGDTQQRDIRARRGKHAVLELLHQLDTFNKTLKSPIKSLDCIPLSDMLAEASRVAHPGSLVILLSDFHDFGEDCIEPLTMLSKRSDVSALHLYDDLEQHLPALNHMAVSNGSHRLSINSKAIGSRFEAVFENRKKALQQACINCGVQYVDTPARIDVDEFAQDLFSAKSRKRKINHPPNTAGA